MAKKPKFNPEKRVWRGRSYKRGGKSIRSLREALFGLFDWVEPW